MTYKVIVTESAEKDIDSIISYIVNELQNKSVALSLIDSIESKYDILAENPYSFEKSRQLALMHRGYRRVVIDNYVLLYLVDDSKYSVTIARVFYGRQDYQHYI